jgi:hypothetical protein
MAHPALFYSIGWAEVRRKWRTMTGNSPAEGGLEILVLLTYNLDKPFIK